MPKRLCASCRIREKEPRLPCGAKPAYCKECRTQKDRDRRAKIAANPVLRRKYLDRVSELAKIADQRHPERAEKRRKAAADRARKKTAETQKSLGPCLACGTTEKHRQMRGKYVGYCHGCAGWMKTASRKAKPCVDCGIPVIPSRGKRARARCAECDFKFCDTARHTQYRKSGPCPRCRERERLVLNTGSVCTYCEECRNEMQKERWHLKRPKYYGKALERMYGITYEEYERIFNSQGGICPICSEPMEMGKNAVVDHCHNSSAVRGILHRVCNSAIGLLKENPDTLRRAAAYIESAGVQNPDRNPT